MKKMLSILLALMVIMGCMSFASAEEVKPVILVVSFGTSYTDNLDLSIGAVENDIAAAFHIALSRILSGDHFCIRIIALEVILATDHPYPTLIIYRNTTANGKAGIHFIILFTGFQIVNKEFLTFGVEIDMRLTIDHTGC